MTQIENKTFGQERALYGSRDIVLNHCAFDGEEDGESALKESQNIEVTDTLCNLRYPFWHDKSLKLNRCTVTENCRAGIWYSENIEITDSLLHGIKALRECSHISITDSDIRSPEFGWSAHHIALKNTKAEGEYFLLRATDVALEKVEFKGKYAFQYVENGNITDCTLDTKDAFWHAKNVTVRNSVIKGEYLGWYSEGLTLVNCKIIGTQPLCYCKNLKLIDCEMENTDLSFEKSEVEATLLTPIVSVKNPKSGFIKAPAVDKIILDDPTAKGKIITKS